MSLFVLFGCQQDDITTNVEESIAVDQPPKEEGLKVRLISDKEIPEIVGLLKNKLSSKAKIKGSKIQQENIVISLDNVKEVSKEGEHTNYNFAVHIDGDHYTDVYVLSVDEQSDGLLGEPIVIKYSIDPKSFDLFLKNDGIIDYKNLKADYTYYNLDNFLATGGRTNLLKSAGCQGTFGSAPGEYPETPPGGSFIHNAFGFNFTITFSSSTTSGSYTYTSTVTNENEEQSNVSTIGSSDIVTTDSEIVGTTSDNIIPDNAESVTDTGNVGSGDGCFMRVIINPEGGFEFIRMCPDADENNTQRSNKSTRGICAPLDYNALNITDLRVEYLDAQMPNFNREFVEENREFANPLVDYENGTRSTPNNHVFPGKVIAGVEAGNIGEIQGLQILFYTNQNGYSPESVAMASAITDAINNGNLDHNAGISMLNHADENGNSSEVRNLIEAVIENNELSDQEFLESINPFMEENTTTVIFNYRFSLEVALIKANHPDWGTTRIRWEATRQIIVHPTLDIIGLVPGFGEPADLINGVIYHIHGDGINAALSYASVLPFAGWISTGTKMGLKVVSSASDVGSKVVIRWIVHPITGVIEFGSRADLRKVLGLVTGDGKHAHHIIPWAMADLPIVQAAARAGDAFHMNDIVNGIALEASEHLVGHANYSNAVREVLQRLTYNNVDEAASEVARFQRFLEFQILFNPGINLGELEDIIRTFI